MDVTLIIPTISERGLLLERAVASAKRQTKPFKQIIVEPAAALDDAATTRQRGLQRVTTPWVTFLDDDDELESNHLEELTKTQQQTGADIVYGWFSAYEHGEPVVEDYRMLKLNGHSAFKQPWGPEQQAALAAGSWCFHLNALFRTSMLTSIGGFQAPGRDQPNQYLSEDLDLEQRLVARGARVAHCPKRTWRWYFWEGRTKGQPAHLR